MSMSLRYEPSAEALLFPPRSAAATNPLSNHSWEGGTPVPPSHPRLESGNARGVHSLTQDGEGGGLQVYLAHKKLPPPQDHRRSLGRGLL